MLYVWEDSLDLCWLYMQRPGIWWHR